MPWDMFEGFIHTRENGLVDEGSNILNMVVDAAGTGFSDWSRLRKIALQLTVTLESKEQYLKKMGITLVMGLSD